jgi:hypothetical protein
MPVQLSVMGLCVVFDICTSSKLSILAFLYVPLTNNQLSKGRYLLCSPCHHPSEGARYPAARSSSRHPSGAPLRPARLCSSPSTSPAFPSFIMFSVTATVVAVFSTMCHHPEGTCGRRHKCVYVCECVCVCMNVCKNVCMNACMNACARVCACVCVCGVVWCVVCVCACVRVVFCVLCFVCCVLCTMRVYALN